MSAAPNIKNNTDEQQSTPPFVHKRSFLRFLIFPKKQLKYAYYHFLIVGAAVTIINIVGYLEYSHLLKVSKDLYASQILTDYVSNFSMTTLIVMGLMGLLSFFTVIVFLHRFVGPLNPLLRHMNAILQEDYSYRTI